MSTYHNDIFVYSSRDKCRNVSASQKITTELGCKIHIISFYCVFVCVMVVLRGGGGGGGGGGGVEGVRGNTSLQVYFQSVTHFYPCH